jgi:hypothetical protein
MWRVRTPGPETDAERYGFDIHTIGQVNDSVRLEDRVAFEES